MNDPTVHAGPPALVRLDKVLANRGYITRSQAGRYLKVHDVRLAGGRQLFKPDEKIDPAGLTVDGEPIDPPALYVMMNKPPGYTSSHKEDGPLVYDLLPERWPIRNPPITTVGRLDKETSGVLLMTDDGAFVHRLTSPKHHVARAYVATLQHPMSAAEVGQATARFASGTMLLEGEEKPLKPAELQMIDDRTARLTLHEGRYHQARRMFAAVGNHVVTLHREAFGPIRLDGLEEGKWRLLTADELAALGGG